MSEENAHRSGFVGIIGKPNVGKSTLLNALLNQKVAAVSPRPQTTRRRQLGILTLSNAQIVFIDTPGIHKPHHRLGEYMNEVSRQVLGDVDVILWVIDTSTAPDEEDRNIAAIIQNMPQKVPVLLILNKADLPPTGMRAEREAAYEEIAPQAAAYQDLLPEATPVLVSAIANVGLRKLLDIILERLPEGEDFYDEEQVTDFFERDIAAELIREAALLHLREEIPHSIAVRIDEFTEREGNLAYIAATIFVEKESHRGIVIGKGGEMIKRIGSAARREIEAMTDRKIFLELRVKMNKNWRNDAEALKRLGYVNEQA